LLDPLRDPGVDFRLDPAHASGAQRDWFREAAFRHFQVNRASGKTRSCLDRRKTQDRLWHHDRLPSPPNFLPHVLIAGAAFTGGKGVCAQGVDKERDAVRTLAY